MFQATQASILLCIKIYTQEHIQEIIQGGLKFFFPGQAVAGEGGVTTVHPIEPEFLNLKAVLLKLLIIVY